MKDANAFDWRRGFKGALLQLLRTELAPYLPTPAALVEGQRWVLDQQERPDALLPLRAFKAHRERGVAFGIFLPVDNEPLVETFARLLEGWTPPSSATFKTLLQSGELPVSWCAPSAPEGYRARAANAPFREKGILLAHVFDASPRGQGDDALICARRYALAMNPLNVAPWPGHRRSSQLVTDAGPLQGQLRGGRDLSGDPVIQEILGGWVAEHVGGIDSDAARRWLASAGRDATDRMRNWERLAADVQIVIEPKDKSSGGPGGPTPPPGGTSTPRKSGALPLELFIAVLEERAASRRLAEPDAEELGSSLSLAATFFPEELADFNVIYRLAPDSKLTAIEKLVGFARTSGDDWTLFAPEVIASGTRCLRLPESVNKANGLHLRDR
jgi:hypothetical protein